MASITTVPSGTPYQFHSWCAPLPGAAPLATMGLANIKPVGQRVDEVTRRVSVSAWELTFLDTGRLRRLNSSVVLKKKWIRVYLGEASLTNLSDWLVIADNLQIDDVLPEKGAIRVPALDTNAFGLDQAIDPFQFPDHPLRLANTILNVLAPPQATGDPSFNERLYTDTSHFVVCRQQYNNRAFNIRFPEINPDRKPFAGLDAMNGLLQLMYGTLWPSASGVAKFSAYDRTATAVRTFRLNQISDFKQITNFQDAWNDVFIVGQNATDPAQSDMWLARGGNPASQTAFGFPTTLGNVKGVISKDPITGPWFNSWSRLGADYNPSFDASASSLSVYLPAYCGFSGSLQTDGSGNLLFPPSTTQQPEHRLSSTRPAMLLITNHHDRVECIRATAATIDSSAGYTRIDSPLTSRDYWNQTTYTGLTRGAIAGVPAVDWRRDIQYERAWIYDVTIPWWMVGTLSDRFGYGAPICSFRTSLRHLDLQVGDVVSFTHQVFLTYGVNAATASDTFEILSIEPTVIGSSPGLVITVGMIRHGAVVPAVPADMNPPDVPVTGSVTDFYFDASGATYFDAFGLGYYAL